jgi:RNA polymerase sigma-70 factor (ECF subfamily)
MDTRPDAFRDAYLGNYRFVWGVLRRLGVRERDAQDVAQKVFLVVYRRLPKLESPPSMRVWLHGICVNAARDYRRSAPIRLELLTEPEAMDFLVGSQNDAHAQSEFRQDAASAETFLAKLPEAQRLVFLLSELQDMSGKEIASLLGLSLGTVRSRLRLARRLFKREIRRLSASRPIPRRLL